ncbi:D-2-hydroxyacid dehydrogenase [Brenneria goodwinii]|uniref:D-3-phosphoglycerate dehydrogenase n=1 Tax=Brenneria goodwinii TaxID=1109412 RepID=A0A0G4JV14_9GAMM|nr:D-2-hydroxyacid dehydrogenase [Brenneria goodwinii]MCG8159009.1 D-2-hydroxyacid dehydrogenase [Brenneria goodwinii]MCG8161768.1 D-2-hydroxyacid dehydrogenase [Brenneria goodwinii]MCG8168258.1 D-2-hydroxyacid dehydrogenase [Brenneria goodwinii]MCG8172887.1 D-2-hydroxyacid dehydrogenase [Brenneria goodwinii]MCG8175348.1 D-2-hydroxyacid dehydrogenase [Brenneria goodwinii]
MTTVLLLDSRAEEIRSALHDDGSSIELVLADGTTEQADSCSIWLGEPDAAADLLARGARPDWLQSTWAGFKPLLAEGLPRDYRLSRAVGVFGQPIAEYVIASLLRHALQLGERQHSQARREWNHRLPGSLAGKKILIVGAGEIGCEVAGFLRPFGVELHGVVNTPRPLPYFKHVTGMNGLQTAVQDADYVINLLPDTAATADIYNSALFAAMKTSALFINVGRGTAVVDADLLAALRNQQLAGAVLDVFRQEPLPEAHPFWREPTITITAHIAGPMVPTLLVRLFLDNLARFRQGETLRGEVDFSKGY